MMTSVTSKITKNVSKNYNVEIMKRILDALYEMVKGKVTDVAIHARLNHHTTKRYLHFMVLLNWAETAEEEDHIIISITETGRIVRSKLHSITSHEDTA